MTQNRNTAERQNRNTAERWAAVLVGGLALAVYQAPLLAQNGDEVTFTKDIAPIFQKSCQQCHRPDSVAPMSLLTYEDARPWARSIKQRTAAGSGRGVMPPWFIEKDKGVQDFKDDISLSDEEIALIAAWVDSGAPRGNPADLPPPLEFTDANAWDIGEPDLIVDAPSFTMAAQAPDYWGALEPVEIGLTEDRYVAAVQVKEVSDVSGALGGRFIYHHAAWLSLDAEGNPYGGWPVHEVGRNADVFDPEASPQLLAGSQASFHSIHVHANGEETTANLRLGFKFHPKGYEPTKQIGGLNIGTGYIDIRPMEANQMVEAFRVLESNLKLSSWEPHLHATGSRMCLEATFGGITETINCAGFDHNWVKVYNYADDAKPLLPKGTLLRMVAFFDNTPSNRNVIEPRNWSGLGHRTIDNMALNVGSGVTLSDEEFQAEVAKRRERLGLAKGETVPGCPLCGVEEFPAMNRLSAAGEGDAPAAGVPVEDAEALLGDWKVRVAAAGQGGFVLDVNLRDEDGTLAATIGNPMMGERDATRIALSEATLLLEWESDMRGQVVSTLLRLTQEGDGLVASFEGPGMQMSGTGSRR